MTLIDSVDSFDHTIDAIASGDKQATAALSAEIIPQLLMFATEHGANDPESVVSRVVLDAFRKVDHFNGTRKQFVATLERVIMTLIAKEQPNSKAADSIRSAVAATDANLASRKLNPIATAPFATAAAVPQPAVTPVADPTEETPVYVDNAGNVTRSRQLVLAIGFVALALPLLFLL